MKPNPKYPYVLSPLKVGKLTFKHRIMSSPTSQAWLAPGNQLSAENIAYYQMRAMGGASLVTVGDCVVEVPTGKSHPMQVAIDDEATENSLTRCADAIHYGGAYASAEIDHGGDRCEPQYLSEENTSAIGPSSFSDPKGYVVREMTRGDIERIADAFAAAAVRVKHCGFDMVMIHGGHGWLLHQFISPLSNKRSDEYGGSFENRMRFPLMVIDRVREAVGKDFPIEFRMSAVEFIEEGYGIETGIEIARAIDDKVDLIHVSAGNMRDPYAMVLMHPPIFSPEAPFAEYARKIKAAVKTPVVLVGAVHDPDIMEALISSGVCDAVALGRGLVADPYLPSKVIRGQQDLISTCTRCLDCEGSLFATRTLRCAVNPFAGRELAQIYLKPAAEKRRVLVAGGGPGGEQAAITAAERGHEVILCEKKDHLGGALEFAATVDFKHRLVQYQQHQEHKLRHCGVDVRLNTAVTPDLVEEIAPDVFIVAIGALPLRLPIPGLTDENVIFAADPEGMRRLKGEKIVIAGGGLVGCETALHLAQEGKEVTLLEMLPDVANDSNFMHRIALKHELEKKVRIRCGVRVTKFEKNAVTAVDEDGREQRFPCDAAIVAMGLVPRSEEVDNLRGLVAETIVIGDCSRSGKIMDATRAGWEAAINLA